MALSLPLVRSLEFITPCFCAGADQTRAEIRAPSVRGQLRWWFRVLGGSPEQETRVFGGVHGEGPSASSLVTRVVLGRRGQPVQLPLPNQPLYYLFHFAKASGKGIRYSDKGYFGPGTGWSVQFVPRRRLDEADGRALEGTLAAFCRLGSLGLRQTRGLGAWADCGEVVPFAEFAAWSATLAPRVEVCWAVGADGKPVFTTTWREALAVLESCLRGFRARFPGEGRPSPLGSSKPRQASGVHLRPVRLAEGLLPVVYLAPGVLDTASAPRGFRLAGQEFAHPQQRGASPNHRLAGGAPQR